MSQYVETGTKSFIAGGSISANTFVKFSSVGVVATAGATEYPIGVALEPAAKDGHVAVRLLNSQGTVKVVAADGVTAGAKVYCKANGKCDDTSGSDKLAGIALETASQTGDIIEIIPILLQS